MPNLQNKIANRFALSKEGREGKGRREKERRGVRKEEERKNKEGGMERRRNEGNKEKIRGWKMVEKERK